MKAGFCEKHQVPEDYALYFLSSATECWQVIAENLVPNRSLHLYNGSFGERWFTRTRAFQPGSLGIAFDLQEPPLLQPDGRAYDLIALTHNETANGTAIPLSFLGPVRGAYPEALVAVDATSSLGGIALPYAVADVWFASVQKCLGLPSGLAVMFVSPRAQQVIESLPEIGRYNSLPYIHKQAKKLETTHTPNMLAIALLATMLHHTPTLTELEARIETEYQRWESWLATNVRYLPLVQDTTLRSRTVIALAPTFCEPETLLADAEAAGFVLAKGYGPWKANTIRVANFPALAPEAHAALRSWLTQYATQ